MEQKLVPDVEIFAQEIQNELRQDLPTQRVKILERLLNLPKEKFSEFHLQDWYGMYWKLTNLFQYVNSSPEQTEKIYNQLIPLVNNETDSIRRQCFAFAFLLLGKTKDFQSLADKKLWSKDLNEDFNNFSNFNKVAGLSTNLRVRANVRRNDEIKKFLFDKYSDLIKKYADFKVNDKTCPKVSPKNYQIYFSWLQGEDNLPPLIRCCYNALKSNAGRFKVIFIDENNFSDYIDLPSHVVDKLKDGKITRTHFSDFLRINLLERYGGLWLDSTVFVSEPLDKYKDFWRMTYYTQKFFQDKSNFCPYISTPSYGRWAGFIQGTSILHHPLFAFEKEFLNLYWKEFDSLVDYVLIDYSMDMAYEHIPFVKKEFDAVPINNDRAWTMLGTLNLPYDKYPYDKIFKGNFLNKFNWKSNLDWDTPNTVLREIQKRYAPETLLTAKGTGIGM